MSQSDVLIDQESDIFFLLLQLAIQIYSVFIANLYKELLHVNEVGAVQRCVNRSE
jgi:hypothetical protein